MLGNNIVPITGKNKLQESTDRCSSKGKKRGEGGGGGGEMVEKHFLEKEKLLATSIFSFSQNDFKSVLQS